MSYIRIPKFWPTRPASSKKAVKAREGRFEEKNAKGAGDYFKTTTKQSANLANK